PTDLVASTKTAHPPEQRLLALVSRSTFHHHLPSSPTLMPSAMVLLSAVAVLLSTAVAAAATKHNVVFILTDDQDSQMRSLDYMPKLKKHLLDQGTYYRKHYCTVALCCPSRVSLWTGKAAHNHNVTDVMPPYVQKFTAFYKDFLLDPWAYEYWNPGFQRNEEPPRLYPGQYSTDLVLNKSLEFLDEAMQQNAPFFLTLAPIAPHVNVNITVSPEGIPLALNNSVPRPAARHADLFPGLKVPRTPNFNPRDPSGVSWVAKLPRLNEPEIAKNDDLFRQRILSLQSVDDMVETVVQRLEELAILDNTYIFYSTDNGYHISQHRLQPGKKCPFEEDMNIPLIVRGPGVAKKAVVDLPTSHVDLAPTFMNILGIPLKDHLDGAPIPIIPRPGAAVPNDRSREHVQVEGWGTEDTNEWANYGTPTGYNNTFKTLRLIGPSYNLLYSVWCTNEHELYDLNTDAGQLRNRLKPGVQNARLLGHPVAKVASRLDGLLYVLKSCSAETCRKPWEALLPGARVESLQDALQARYDGFFETSLPGISFSSCQHAYFRAVSKPKINQSSEAYSSRAPLAMEPLTLDEIEALAKDKLPKHVYDFYASGSDSQNALARNRTAFSKLFIRPRVLRDVSDVNTSVSILGFQTSLPIGIAPSAMQKLAGGDGEVDVAKAAADMSLNLTLSSQSTTSLEDVIRVRNDLHKSSGTPPFWMQIYLHNDMEKSVPLIKRAEAAGYQALVLTVDTPVLGNRLSERKTAVVLPSGVTLPNIKQPAPTGKPQPSINRQLMNVRSAAEAKALREAHGSSMHSSSLTWERTIKSLREVTQMKVILKGIMTGEDAALAVQHGADAIIVSNHGGRQLDDVCSTIEALPDVVSTVRGAIPVIMDGGIRTGSDVFKALALGADFVLVGRPALWGLAYNGRDGVETVMNILERELSRTMALAGVTNVNEICRDMLGVESRDGFGISKL
ncbi:hypothetical protein S40288_02392, partial [Stachybotrys chartarum IBT 40288]